MESPRPAGVGLLPGCATVMARHIRRHHPRPRCATQSQAPDVPAWRLVQHQHGLPLAVLLYLRWLFSTSGLLGSAQAWQYLSRVEIEEPFGVAADLADAHLVESRAGLFADR